MHLVRYERIGLLVILRENRLERRPIFYVTGEWNFIIILTLRQYCYLAERSF